MSDILIDDIELHRLNDCATSTKYGTVDRGFPFTFKRLEPIGLVEKRGDGYVVTTLGFEFIKANKDRLFQGKHRKKRPKKFDREDFRDGDDND